MTENVEEKLHGPFKKNDPRINRTGRPKGSISIISRIKQKFIENPEYFDEYVSKMLEDPSLRKAIMEQIDGKPKESVDHTTKGKPMYLPPELLVKHELDNSTEQDSDE